MAPDEQFQLNDNIDYDFNDQITEPIINVSPEDEIEREKRLIEQRNSIEMMMREVTLVLNDLVDHASQTQNDDPSSNEIGNQQKNSVNMDTNDHINYVDVNDVRAVSVFKLGINGGTAGVVLNFQMKNEKKNQTLYKQLKHSKHASRMAETNECLYDKNDTSYVYLSTYIPKNDAYIIGHLYNIYKIMKNEQLPVIFGVESIEMQYDGYSRNLDLCLQVTEFKNSVKNTLKMSTKSARRYLNHVIRKLDHDFFRPSL